jgi:hypothetical protein
MVYKFENNSYERDKEWENRWNIESKLFDKRKISIYNRFRDYYHFWGNMKPWYFFFINVLAIYIHDEWNFSWYSSYI